MRRMVFGVAAFIMATTSFLYPTAAAADKSRYQTENYTGSFAELSSKYTPDTPEFTKEASGFNTIRVKWNKVKNATGYKVGICIKGRWRSFENGTGTSHTFKGLDRHTKYRFRVRAYRKVDGRTFFSQYSYVTLATNRTLKSKAAFNIYGEPNTRSERLYHGSSNVIIKQKGFSTDGWVKVFVPHTKTIGYTQLNKFAGYANLNIDPINQYGGEGGGCMYYGCEATSLATILDRQYNISTSKNLIADRYIPNIAPGSGDPNYAFWGSPYASSGYGVYAPAIAQAANWYLKDIGKRDKFNIEMHTNFITENNPTGCTLNLDNLSLGNIEITEGYKLSQIKKELNKGHSLIVWWTLNAESPYPTETHILRKGTKYTAAGSGTYSFTWIGHQHCAVISGYDDVNGTIQIADVHYGRIRKYSYARFLKGYKAYSRQTVVVYPKNY